MICRIFVASDTYDPDINDVSDKRSIFPVMILWIIIMKSDCRISQMMELIYMLPSAYSCIGITYNKTLLEEHGWSLPNHLPIWKIWQQKRKRLEYSCAWHRSNIRVMVFSICATLRILHFQGTFQGKRQNIIRQGKANVRDALGMKRILEAMGRPEKNFDGEEILYFCWEVKRVLGKQMIQGISLV